MQADCDATGQTRRKGAMGQLNAHRAGVEMLTEPIQKGRGAGICTARIPKRVTREGLSWTDPRGRRGQTAATVCAPIVGGGVTAALAPVAQSGGVAGIGGSGWRGLARRRVRR